MSFRGFANARRFTPSPVVRGLLNIRLFVGRLLGWDREPAANAWESFATRLTSADLSKSLVPAGTREGPFRVVYRFENEQRQPLHADLHGTDRPVPQADRLSGAPALCPRDLGPTFGMLV